MDLVPYSLFYFIFEVMSLLDLSKSCCFQSLISPCCINCCIKSCLTTTTHLRIYFIHYLLWKWEQAYSCHFQFSRLWEPMNHALQRMLLANIKRLFLALLMRNILKASCNHVWQSSNCWSFHFGLHTFNGHSLSNFVIEMYFWVSRFLNNYSFFYLYILVIFYY